MKKKTCIIVDLDNTVCGVKNPQPLPIENTREQWDIFHKKVKFYHPKTLYPIKPVIEIIENFFNKGVYVIFMTAREDCAKGLVRLNSYRFIKKHFKQFNKPQSFNNDYKIIMRQPNDFRSSSEVKQDLLTKCVLPYYNVIMALDDDENNIQMFSNNNILTLKVQDSNDSYKKN